VAETFSEYFHDKVTLANQVPIEEEEIVDYLIEGMSDVHLRNQAKIQRFTTKETLLEAFKQVRLDLKEKGDRKKGTTMRKKKRATVQKRRSRSKQKGCDATIATSSDIKVEIVSSRNVSEVPVLIVAR